MHRLRPLHRALHRTLSQAPHRQSPQWPPTPPWNQSQTHQPRTAATPPPPPGTPAQRLQLSYHDLERALERRGLNTVRVLLLSSLAAAAGFGLAWPRIKRWGAVEGAEVAAASLETERLQQRALGMVREVLTDERTGRQVERVIKEAAVGVLRDNEFKASAVEWCAAVLAEALRWEEVRDEGERYLGAVVEGGRERVEEVLAEVVANVARDENVQDKVAKGLWSSLRASVIGRRRPQVEAGEADGAMQDGVGKGPLSEKEGVIAPSTLDDAMGSVAGDGSDRDLG